jgi:hypothetical protein
VISPIVISPMCTHQVGYRICAERPHNSGPFHLEKQGMRRARMRSFLVANMFQLPDRNFAWYFGSKWSLCFGFWTLNCVSKHDFWDQHFGLPDPEFWRWLFSLLDCICNCCTQMLLHVFFWDQCQFVSADHDETNGLYSVWFSVFTRFYESGNFKGPQLLGTEQTQSKKSTGFSSLVVQVGAVMNISDVFSFTEISDGKCFLLEVCRHLVKKGRLLCSESIGRGLGDEPRARQELHLNKLRDLFSTLEGHMSRNKKTCR